MYTHVAGRLEHNHLCSLHEMMVVDDSCCIDDNDTGYKSHPTHCPSQFAVTCQATSQCEAYLGIFFGGADLFHTCEVSLASA